MLIPQREPTAPGIVLQEHYLTPRGINVTAFAAAVGCSRKHMSHILHGKARLEAGLAVRISEVLETTPGLWINLQNAVDLHRAKIENRNWKPARTFLSPPYMEKEARHGL